MKHKTWFRLVIRAIGVLLIGLSIPTTAGLLGQIAMLLQNSSSASMYPAGYGLYQLFYFAGGFLELSFGLYLFFGGTWIVNKAIPSNRPYCPDCGYDLSNSRSDRCAECGCALPRDVHPSEPV